MPKLTTAETAIYLNDRGFRTWQGREFTARTVLTAIQNGKLDATKEGGVWQIEKADAVASAKEHGLLPGEITGREAAQILGVSPQRVSAMIRAEQLQKPLTKEAVERLR